MRAVHPSDPERTTAATDPAARDREADAGRRRGVLHAATWALAVLSTRPATAGQWGDGCGAMIWGSGVSALPALAPAATVLLAVLLVGLGGLFVVQRRRGS